MHFIILSQDSEIIYYYQLCISLKNLKVIYKNSNIKDCLVIKILFHIFTKTHLQFQNIYICLYNIAESFALLTVNIILNFRELALYK
jgi:hypothetical protein